MKAGTSQAFLLGLACPGCPVEDCPDREDAARACPEVEYQIPDLAGLTHWSDDLPALLDQLCDFRLPDNLPQASAQALPPYVPQIEPHSPLLDKMPGTTGLTLSEFISPKGQSYDSGITKAHKIRTQGAATTVLVGTSTDPQLEAVWRDPPAFLKALRTAEVDIVLGPAFSIYLGRPPLERHANRSRNLYLYRCLNEAGIPAIPAVGFVDEYDAALVGEWVARLGLRSIFVDLQSADTHANWDLVCKTIPTLLGRGTSLQRLVVNGVAKPNRVVDLARLTKPLDLVLTNGNAFHLARSRRDYRVDRDKYIKQPSTAPPPQLFANVSSFYNEAVARRIERYVPLSLPAIPFEANTQSTTQPGPRGVPVQGRLPETSHQPH